METDVIQFSIASYVMSDYTIRQTTLEGKPHLVVPVVMMREGVHNGSHGAIYHCPEELIKFVHAWNGIPVTIQHPQKDGENEQANTPEMLEAFAVGKVFHTRYEDGLRAEAWINIERIQNIDATALAYIRQGRALDVSVGVFTDEDTTPGEWNSETYESIARNYRPDHLALLPGAVGACSWEDGCGIRNNKEGGTMNDLLKTFKEMAGKGYAVSLISNEQGYQELLQLLSSKLDSMDNDERMYFLEEVYDNYIVYRIRARDGGGGTLYKRDYTIAGNEVTLGEAPVEVRKEVSYVTMEMKRTKNVNINNNEKKEVKMSETKDKPCCEAKVDALIANKATQFSSVDREWLMTQEEAIINKLAPVEKTPDTPKPPAVNAEEVVKTFKSTLKTVEDYVELMPEEMKAQVNQGVKLFNDHREKLIKHIQDNTDEGIWTEDELKTMQVTQLEKIEKSIKVNDYSGQGAEGTQNNEDGPEPLYPAGVKFETN